MKIELERLGHRVSVFTPILDELSIEPCVYRVDTSKRSAWSRAMRRLFGPRSSLEKDNEWLGEVIASAILRVHKFDPIDVIEMEESFGWFESVGRTTLLPLVIKLHGPAFLSYVGSELLTSFAQRRIDLEGKALLRARTILSPSEKTLKQTMERYSLSPEVAEHIVNPIDIESTTVFWSLDACDRNTILFVGRFDLRKGADIILKAFFLLLKERPQLKLIFVGPDVGVLLSDGSEIKFDAYCDNFFSPEMRKSIDFRGSIANHEVAALRRKAFATIIASRWENQGYALLEAMMQACPVVSSDAGGNPEIVVDGISGRLARSEDPVDFAEKIASLLDQPERAATMAHNGRQYVVDRHAAAKVAHRSIEIYQRVTKVQYQ